MSCPACGGAARPWIEARGGEPSDPGRYRLERCEDCGSALSTGPAPPPSAYEQGVYRTARPRWPWLIGALQRVAARQPLRLLERAGLPAGGRVLDVGAGQGRLVAALAAAGHSASGIDSSARSVELAAAAGRPVTRESVAQHEDAELDAAVLWHVLEHVDEPAAALARIRGWLRPDGLLLVAVPSIDSLQARIAGRRWFHLDLPRHRTHFTAAGLRALLDRTGFELVTLRQLVPEHNFPGMWFTLLGRLGMTPGYPFHLVKRNSPLRSRDFALLLIAGPPLLPVAIALELIAAALRRGGTVAVVARVQTAS